MPFLKVLVQRETKSVSFRIWTRVTEFIYFNDNRYVANLFAINDLKSY